jgi:hypothetical protein
LYDLHSEDARAVVNYWGEIAGHHSVGRGRGYSISDGDGKCPVGQRTEYRPGGDLRPLVSGVGCIGAVAKYPLVQVVLRSFDSKPSAEENFYRE